MNTFSEIELAALRAFRVWKEMFSPDGCDPDCDECQAMISIGEKLKPFAGTVDNDEQKGVI